MPKERSSPVWTYFRKQDNKYAVCAACNAKISHNGGTSNLYGHLRSVHQQQFAEIRNAPNARPAGEPNRDHYELVKFISKDMQPFSIVEDAGFQAFVRFLAPTYVLPTRKHISQTLIPRRYEEVKAKLHPLVAAATHVAITTDLWTAKNQTSYISLTAHFLASGVLRSAVLASKPLPGSHTAVNIAECIRTILDEWGCRGKVAAFTTDNGANMLAAMAILNVRNIPCVAHTINLVVNDALSRSADVMAIVNKCKGIVTFFKSSTVASDLLKTNLTALGDKELRLIQAVPTRWNSALDMVERILAVIDALAMTQLRIVHSPDALTAQEIRLCKDVVTALKPYKTATATLSGEKYPTVSLIIPIVQGIADHLTRVQGEMETDAGRSFLDCLQTSTRSRLFPYEAMKMTRGGTFLDPRFKRFGFRLAENSENARHQIEAELRLHPGSREPQDAVSPPALTAEEAVPGSSLACGLFDCVRSRVWESRAASTSSSSAIATVRQYREREPMYWNKDLVQYWVHSPIDGQDLAHVACRYLVAQATSVPSERVFSSAGQILSDRRNSLKPQKAASLIFLKQNQWLF